MSALPGAVPRERPGGPGAARLKRLKIRSWRRGIKECDLILGSWSDTHLAALDAALLDLYEALLTEDDHDIYAWIAGSAPAPEAYSGLITRIAAETTPLTRQV